MAKAVRVCAFHSGKFEHTSQRARDTANESSSGAVSAPKEMLRLSLCPFRLRQSIEDVTKYWRYGQEDRFTVLHCVEVDAAISHAIAGECCHITNPKSGVAEQEHHRPGSTSLIGASTELVTGGEDSHDFFLSVRLLRFRLDLWRFHFLSRIRGNPFPADAKSKEVP